MAAKIGIAKVVSVVEKVAEPVTGDVVKQIKPPMPEEDIRMLYGDFGQVPSDAQIESSREFHGMRDSQALKSARQQHAAILGGTPQAPSEQQPILNPFSKKQARKVGPQQIRTAVQNLRSSAEDLGTERQNVEGQQRRKELEEEEEAKKKKAEGQARLDNVVEAPPGKVTGLAFGKRKRTTLRMMSRPPRSAETRASRGVGG